MRRLTLTLGLVGIVVTSAQAQLVVTDPAVTLENIATATVKEYLLNTEREQHRRLRRMARRLSMHTDLRKYALPDPPRWRTHDFENPEVFLFARGYTAALNYGDVAGAAWLAVSHPIAPPRQLPDGLPAHARRAVAARLATLDLADALATAATHDTGQLRYNGRRELRAIEGLEADVIDSSNEQSAGAVLDKISGATLIAARQRQARVQLLTGIVEQLLVDSKRARDAETGAMNMQLVAWRDGRAAGEAFARGSGDALRTWRQP
jgi:hypothetical protein